MKVKQLGNGGAFNYQMPNSAFLIENQDKYLLFDCGYSVYAELRKQDEAGDIALKKLGSIYISHMDDDHMGSLKTLLYYQYFVNGITVKVYAHAEVFDAVQELLRKTNLKLEHGKYVKTPIVEVVRLYSFVKEGILGEVMVGLNSRISHCNHHTTCYGLSLENPKTGAILFISGDTKAAPEIADTIDNILSKKVSCKIFHDFSHWDCEGAQVHACKSDTERLYSQEVRDAITWYHNDEPFDGNWQTV